MQHLREELHGVVRQIEPAAAAEPSSAVIMKFRLLSFTRGFARMGYGDHGNSFSAGENTNVAQCLLNCPVYGTYL